MLTLSERLRRIDNKLKGIEKDIDNLKIIFRLAYPKEYAQVYGEENVKVD